MSAEHPDTPPAGDDSEHLSALVNEALGRRQALAIVGGNSKAFIGASSGWQRAREQCQPLSTRQHSGIVRYEPTELFVTVRAGTPLDVLNETLRRGGQMLAFEPPALPGGTIGGVIACGLSGPRRLFAGAARDHVLGCRFINGRGERLRVGGEVMKNVAGYDVSRLQTGAFGTLGLLLEISLKVMPLPAASLTLSQHFADDEAALASLVPLLRQPLPITGAVVHKRQRLLRLEGSEAALEAATAVLGGEPLEAAAALWQSLCDGTHAFFAAADEQHHLWRIACPPQAASLALGGRWLHDWAGGLRWLLTEESASTIQAAAAACGGHATCYSPSLYPENAFQPLPPAMASLQRQLRRSFDPAGLINPSRFHL